MKLTSTDWDARFLALAQHVSSWSKDPSTKVGAVLTGSDKRDIALGYNGFPPGILDAPARLGDRAQKLRRIIHAERNVLDNARFTCKGATLYATHPPCSQCALSIVSKGVARVHISPIPSDFIARWGAEIFYSREILNEAGVSHNF